MKYRIVLTAILTAVVAAFAHAQTPPVSQKRLAWELGSSISLAGVVFAQSPDKALIARQFDQASSAAKGFEIDLPRLPAKTGKRVEDSAAALHYLLVVTGKPIGKRLQDLYGPEHAAIFEIALKSNLLLMLYGPGEKEVNTIAEVIKDRQVKANLPPALTENLMDLIAQKATYEDVKKEIFELHKYAPEFIAVQERVQSGERAYANKDYAGSAAAFSDAIALDPNGPEHYFLRGRAYLRLTKYNEAIADYNKFIQLQGASTSVARNLPMVYHNRGWAYIQLTKFPLAILDLTKAIELRPDFAAAYRLRGLVYKKMGNPAKAEADMQEAERFQPGITK